MTDGIQRKFFTSNTAFDSIFPLINLRRGLAATSQPSAAGAEGRILCPLIQRSLRATLSGNATAVHA
jgi:hypothetical protein